MVIPRIVRIVALLLRLFSRSPLQRHQQASASKPEYRWEYKQREKCSRNSQGCRCEIGLAKRLFEYVENWSEARERDGYLWARVGQAGERGGGQVNTRRC